MSIAAISPEWAKRMKTLGGFTEEAQSGTFATDEEDGYLKQLASQTIQPYRPGFAALPGVGASIMGGLAARQLRQNAEQRQGAESAALKAYMAPMPGAQPAQPTFAPTPAPTAPTYRGAPDAGRPNPQPAPPQKQPAQAGFGGELTRLQALIERAPPGPLRERALARYQSMSDRMNDPDREYARQDRDLDRQMKLAQLERLRRKDTGPDVDHLIKLEKLKQMQAEKPERPDTNARKYIYESQDEMPNIEGAIERLTEAKGLLPKIYSGYGVETKSRMGLNIPGGSFFVDPDRAKATQRFGGIMSGQALEAMSATLKGATSDFELSQFKEMIADPTLAPEVKARVIDDMLVRVKRRREVLTGRVQELGGEVPQGMQAAPQPNQAPSAPTPTGRTPSQLSIDALRKDPSPEAIAEFEEYFGVPAQQFLGGAQ